LVLRRAARPLGVGPNVGQAGRRPPVLLANRLTGWSFVNPLVRFGVSTNGCECGITGRSASDGRGHGRPEGPSPRPRDGSPTATPWTILRKSRQRKGGTDRRTGLCLWVRAGEKWSRLHPGPGGTADTRGQACLAPPRAAELTPDRFSLYGSAAERMLDGGGRRRRKLAAGAPGPGQRRLKKNGT